MTTRTIKSGAPTEAEIREAITRELGRHMMGEDDFGGLADEFRALLDSDMALTRRGWVEELAADYAAAHPGTIWADMTTEEASELHEAMQSVLGRVCREATDALVEGCVAAAVAFAAAHPDVPRGAWRAREAAPA